MVFLNEYLEVGEGVLVEGGEAAVPHEDLLQVGQVLLKHSGLKTNAPIIILTQIFKDSGPGVTVMSFWIAFT